MTTRYIFKSYVGSAVKEMSYIMFQLVCSIFISSRELMKTLLDTRAL